MTTSLVLILGILFGQQSNNPKYSAQQEFFYNQRGHYIARSWTQGRYSRYYDSSGFYIGRSQEYRNGSFGGKEYFDSRGRYLGRTVITPNNKSY